jgi:hypothetical protein
MPSIVGQKSQDLRRKAIFFGGIFAFVIGCASQLPNGKSSKNDIPSYKRKVPSLEKAIIIDLKGPSLDPKYYEVMGRADSQAGNVSALVSHCKAAIEMLRYEAEIVGGDALIDVSCTSGAFNATANGTIITFKNRGEALKALKDIKAVLK